MDVSVSHAAAVAGDPPLLDRRQTVRLARRAAIPVAGCAVAGAIIGYAVAATLPKSYTAEAAIAVEGSQIAIPELSGVLRSDNSPDPMPWVRTEEQALTGRQLLENVIATLHLDRNPEFNPALRPETLLGHFEGWLKSLLPAKHATTGNDHDLVLNTVERALVITQDNRSLVIGVDFTAHDPRIAASFVNTLVSDYIAGRAQQRGAMDAGANADLARRVAQVRQEIDSIENHMRDLRTTSQVVGLRAGSVGQQQLEGLATAASQATLERMQLEATLARANGLAAGGSSGELASVLGSETISKLRDREATAAARAADLSARYGAAYPDVQSADADLSATRRELANETGRIIGSLQVQLRVARAHEADVQKQLEAARRSSVTAQNVEAELDQLKQDATTRRELYRTLLDREQQTVAQPAGTETPDLRVLSRAAPPQLPSKPNMKLASGFGGLAGGMFGFAGFLAAQSLRDPIDPERFGHLAGADPAILVRRRSALASRVLNDPRGEEAQALRQFRARLRAAPRVRAARAIGFSAGRSPRMASDVALAFARVAAMDGRRALLIDAAAPERRGAGEFDWREAVEPDSVPSLDVLNRGAPDLLAAEGHGVAMENLLAEAREEYELVVVAAGGGEAGAAAASRCDLPVLVAEPGLAQAEAVRLGRSMRAARGGLAALILTN